MLNFTLKLEVVDKTGDFIDGRYNCQFYIYHDYKVICEGFIYFNDLAVGFPTINFIHEKYESYRDFFKDAIVDAISKNEVETMQEFERVIKVNK